MGAEGSTGTHATRSERLLTSRAGALGHLGRVWRPPCNHRSERDEQATGGKGSCESTRNGRGISITLQQKTPS